MKKQIQTVVACLLAVLFAFCSLSCGKTSVVPSELWENAVYLSDTELGSGNKTVQVEVQAGEKTVLFTIHTDKDTVGAALIENSLIEGDLGEYGLYVKKVNGITADYDIDQSYWSLFINDEYAMSGVDTTEITEGAVYRLAYTK